MKTSWLIVVFFLLCSVFFVPGRAVNTATVTRSAKATHDLDEWGNYWTMPEKAFESDDVYASAMLSQAHANQNYTDFGLAWEKAWVSVVSLVIAVEAHTDFDVGELRIFVFNGFEESSGHLTGDFPVGDTVIRTDVTSDFTIWGALNLENLIVEIRTYGLTGNLIYVDHIFAELTVEVKAAGGEEWVPVNLPNLPEFVRRFLEWLRERILENKTIIGLSASVLALAILIRGKKPKKPKLPSWAK